MKPAALILDLLRTYSDKGTSVKTIMSTGRMFGFSENLIRVNLSRLVTKNTVENFRRGYYRLSHASDPVNDFVERWRLGEQRRKTWVESTWNCIHINTPLTSRGAWALTNNGFREVVDNLWIRPDNLSLEAKALKQLLLRLGLQDSAVMISGARVDETISDLWYDNFNLKDLDQTYTKMIQKLNRSLTGLRNLPIEAAKKESFNLGGSAISLLVKDPLIPEQYYPADNRINLWQTMLRYDEQGRNVWASKPAELPDAIPTSRLAAVNLQV